VNVLRRNKVKLAAAHVFKSVSSNQKLNMFVLNLKAESDTKNIHKWNKDTLCNKAKENMIRAKQISFWLNQKKQKVEFKTLK